MKKILAIFIIVVSAYFIGVQFFQNSSKVENSETAQNATDNVEPDKNLAQTSANDANDAKMFSADMQYDETMQWRKENFGKYDVLILSNADYNQYDLEELELLSEQGDFAAMHVLAWKYMNLVDPKNAMRVYKQAAKYGSTSALKRLASLENALKKWDANSDKVLREGALTKLAYFQAALLRGDSTVLQDASYQLKYIENSESDKRYVQKRGREIYNYFEKQRLHDGLGTFDNKVPSYADEYFSFYNKEYSSLISGESSIMLVN